MTSHETFASLYWWVESKILFMVRDKVIVKFLVMVSIKVLFMERVIESVMEWFAMKIPIVYSGALRPTSWSMSMSWSLSWKESDSWSGSGSYSWYRSGSWLLSMSGSRSWSESWSFSR